MHAVIYSSKGVVSQLQNFNVGNDIIFRQSDFWRLMMGDKGGSKDKGKKEKQKQAKQSPKEKRKARIEKKNKPTTQS